MTTVRVEGLRELDAQLARLKPATGKAALRRSLKNASQPLATLMSSMAARRTGALAGSAGVSTKLSRRQRGLHKKLVRDDQASVEMFVGFGPLAQATQMEFGNYKDTPQPAARPAWDADQRALLDRLKGELWSEITKTINRAAARGTLRG